jgi:hypothetical protein
MVVTRVESTLGHVSASDVEPIRPGDLLNGGFENSQRCSLSAESALSPLPDLNGTGATGRNDD